MTIAPVFSTLMGEGIVRSYCVGTCLHLTPRLVVTCDHVAGVRESSSLSIGVDTVAVTRVRRSTSLDLALVELAAPRPCVPVRFSRQWRLDNVYAHGFPGAPFDRPVSDGPLALTRAMTHGDATRTVSFPIATPEGFSGGPIVGTDGRQSYCIGLTRLGGTGYGVGVLIAADTVAAFVNDYEPGTASIVDLSYLALLNFLAHAQDQAARSWRDRGPQPSVMVSARGFADTNVPMVALERINRVARPSLEAGQVPARVAIAVDASNLCAVLLETTERHPVAVIGRLVTHLQPSLRFTEALSACLRRGALVLVVTNYSGFQRGPLDNVTKFLVATRRYLATRHNPAGGNHG